MKKYFNNKMNIIVFVLAFICICSLLVSILFLNDKSADAICKIAICCLSVCLGYFINDILKMKIGRDNYFENLRNTLIEFEQIPNIFEEESGKRIEYLSEDEIFKICKKNEKFILKELSSILENTYKNKDILYESEKNQLSEIERLKCGIPKQINLNLNSEDDKKICVGNIREICKIIFDLTNSVKYEDQNRGKKKMCNKKKKVYQ